MNTLEWFNFFPALRKIAQFYYNDVTHFYTSGDTEIDFTFFGDKWSEIMLENNRNCSSSVRLITYPEYYPSIEKLVPSGYKVVIECGTNVARPADSTDLILVKFFHKTLQPVVFLVRVALFNPTASGRYNKSDLQTYQDEVLTPPRKVDNEYNLYRIKDTILQHRKVPAWNNIAETGPSVAKKARFE